MNKGVIMLIKFDIIISALFFFKFIISQGIDIILIVHIEIFDNNPF